MRTLENGRIELSIPLAMQYSVTESEMSCHICAHPFCPNTACCRAVTNQACCSQPICASCACRLAKACTCRDECCAIITFCPFCREVCPVTSQALFLGLKRPTPCVLCKARETEDGDAERGGREEEEVSSLEADEAEGNVAETGISPGLEGGNPA